MGANGTNGQDQSNNGKTSKPNHSIKADSTTNSVTKSSKKYEKSKDQGHKCRCSGASKSAGGRTAATQVAANAALFRNLPVRPYEKLSPIPSKSISKASSSDSKSDQATSPKAINHNGTTLDASSSSSSSSKPSKDATNGTKKDDTIILQIGSLDKNIRRLSSLSINRVASDRARSKIKVRTKTDPHPISSSQKLRDFPSLGTLTATVTGSTHTAASKCNCSSCKSMSSSVSHSDNHNKTKSVGTQHDATNAYDPWVRQNDAKLLTSTASASSSSASKNQSIKSTVLEQKIANSNAKVIVITDDFKKKALNQEVFIDTKRKMLRYMKANKLTNSSRSMDDDNINEPIESAKLDKQKAISKSVDNVSQLSTELDQLDNVGSVELIFISDEFLNKIAKPDVIILVSNISQIVLKFSTKILFFFFCFDFPFSFRITQKKSVNTRVVCQSKRA